jgi:hypothetical protein
LQLSFSTRSNQWMFEEIIYTISINQYQITKNNHRTIFRLLLIMPNGHQINNRYNSTRVTEDRSKK